jgi:uncharacterized coiled-coil DUF342 family protein
LGATSFPRHKLTAKVKETEEALESLQNKYSSLDKTRQRIAAELEDLNLDVEKVVTIYRSIPAYVRHNHVSCGFSSKSPNFS